MLRSASISALSPPAWRWHSCTRSSAYCRGGTDRDSTSTELIGDGNRSSYKWRVRVSRTLSSLTSSSTNRALASGPSRLRDTAPHPLLDVPWQADVSLG